MWWRVLYHLSLPKVCKCLCTALGLCNAFFKHHCLSQHFRLFNETHVITRKHAGMCPTCPACPVYPLCYIFHADKTSNHTIMNGMTGNMVFYLKSTNDFCCSFFQTVGIYFKKIFIQLASCLKNTWIPGIIIYHFFSLVTTILKIWLTSVFFIQSLVVHSHAVHY